MTVQYNLTVQPESGRIALILENARQCAILQALGKKRPIGLPCPPVRRLTGAAVPLSSALTASKTACLTYSSPAAGPSSVRTNAVQRAAQDAARNPLDPMARFSAYARPIPPPVCPPIPQEILNANEPRAQGLRCSLLNRPDLIVLPG